MSDSQVPELHIAVGVIRKRSGDVLIAKRRRHVHQGDLWEFPGGKLEPMESTEQALYRELQEELGITVTETQPLIQIHYTYPDRRVLLDVWSVQRFTGEPAGQEGQTIAWVNPVDLCHYAFPAANRPIVEAICLPTYYPILDLSTHADIGVLPELFESLARRGHELIQLRAKYLDPEQYASLALDVCRQARQRNIRLLLNAEPQLAVECAAAGVHLTAQRLMRLRQRPLDRSYCVGASCHNLAELRQAERLELNFAVLAPVLPTQTHPEARPIGWSACADLLQQVNIPVYALGGLGAGDLDRARRHGAQGVAGIRAFTDRF